MSDDKTDAIQTMDPNEATLLRTERHRQEFPNFTAIFTPEVVATAMANKDGVEAFATMVGIWRDEKQKQERIAFFEDMNELQRRIGTVVKNKVVEFVTNSGDTVVYGYANLPQLERSLDAAGARSVFGFAWSWPDFSPESPGSDRFRITCKVEHRLGHAETSYAYAAVSRGKGMSGSQAITAAQTTAQRQSLVNAFGLVTEAPPEMDTAKPTPESTGEEIQRLRKLLPKDVREKFDHKFGPNPPADVLPLLYRKINTMINKSANTKGES